MKPLTPRKRAALQAYILVTGGEFSEVVKENIVVSNKPKRIQLRRTRGWRKPESAVVVSRPTKWGNPFNWQDIAIQPGYETQKELAVVEFRRWLQGDPPYVDCFPKERQWILDHIHELAGKDLACWCKPDESCHADVLIEWANLKKMVAK